MLLDHFLHSLASWPFLARTDSFQGFVES
jgi:hypothetical protein